jgi:xylulokinase
LNFLGIDIGTSGCKACVFDLDGVLLRSAFREYGLEHPNPGLSEIDVKSVWAAVCDAIAEVATAVRLDPIAALSVSSFGESVVPMGRDGQALARSILYSDPRGGEEAALLEGRLGRDRLVSISGTRASGT